LLIQESANHSSLTKKHEIRILCLGESTTAGFENSYPRQMEVMLNNATSTKKYLVINKGIPGITTDEIIEKLQQNLAQYKPDIVIVMMGINDGAFYTRDNSPLLHALSSFRTFKLFRFLIEHIRHKITEVNKPPKEAINEPSEIPLQAAITKDPKDYNSWLNLGLFYKNQARYPEAIEAFNKAFLLTPDDHMFFKIVILWCLGECYKSTGFYQKAIDCYQKVLIAMPQHSRAWADLAEVYIKMQDYATAETLLTRQIMIEPHDVNYYYLLMSCYKYQKKLDEVEPMLRYAIKINPNSLELNQMLGYFLMEEKKYQKAEEVFQEVLRIDPANKHNLRDHILGQMVVIYNHLSQPDKVRMIEDKFNHQLGMYSSHTWKNYHMLIEMLRTKGMPLIIMQYPLRDPQPLKDNLGDRHITYVDNRQPFNEIVSERGYDYIFIDHFAGDFGHCTLEGNKILAHNAAESVLQEFVK